MDEDIINKHGVSLYGSDKIALLLPPMQAMSKTEALVLAAWLVALADPLGEKFPEILEKVKSS